MYIYLNQGLFWNYELYNKKLHVEQIYHIPASQPMRQNHKGWLISMSLLVYLLPGRGEYLADPALGGLIVSLGARVDGRDLAGSFESLPLSQQIEAVRLDLKEHWHGDALVVGRSYGAYILLQTLAELEHFPGAILLLSPVLGSAIDPIRMYGSIPPRTRRLRALVEQGKFPAPRSLQIHTGALDNGCDPGLALMFARCIQNTGAFIVPRAGHQLSGDYLAGVLREFIQSASSHGPNL